MNKSHAKTNSPSFDFEKTNISIQSLKSIVESSHINFLIGAGTSSASFPPLGNIEDVLTELAHHDSNNMAKSLVRASIQAYFFENIIKRNLDILNNSNEATISLESYRRFIRSLNRILLERNSSILSKQVNIFTTNIDMLLELSMERLGVEYSDGFIGKIRPKFDHSDFGTLRSRIGSRYERHFQIPVFNLIKIHGSVSWRQQDNGNDTVDIYFDHGLSLVKEVEITLHSAKPHLIDVEAIARTEISSPEISSVNDLVDAAIKKLRGRRKIPSEVEAFTSKYNELGIVNPDKQKFATTVLNETYYELIRRFANELEKENCVLFVHGFSFRDEHLRNLVLRAARTNPTLYVLVFCYNHSAKINYINLLPPEQIKNNNIIFITPDKVEDENNEKNIDLDTLVEKHLIPIIIDKIPQSERISYFLPSSTNKEQK